MFWVNLNMLMYFLRKKKTHWWEVCFNSEYPIPTISIRKPVLVHLLLYWMKSSNSQEEKESEKLQRNDGLFRLFSNPKLWSSASEICSWDTPFIFPVPFSGLFHTFIFVKVYWSRFLLCKSVENLMNQKQQWKGEKRFFSTRLNTLPFPPPLPWAFS